MYVNQSCTGTRRTWSIRSEFSSSGVNCISLLKTSQPRNRLTTFCCYLARKDSDDTMLGCLRTIPTEQTQKLFGENLRSDSNLKLISVLHDFIGVNISRITPKILTISLLGANYKLPKIIIGNSVPAVQNNKRDSQHGYSHIVS